MKISSCKRKLLPVIGNIFLWLEILSSDIPQTGNFSLWPDILSCNRKFLLVTENFFLWLETFACKRIFLFFWQEIFSSDRKLLPVTGNFFLRQEISVHVVFHTKKILGRKFYNISSGCHNLFYFLSMRSRNKKFPVIMPYYCEDLMSILLVWKEN